MVPRLGDETRSIQRVSVSFSCEHMGEENASEGEDKDASEGNGPAPIVELFGVFVNFFFNFGDAAFRAVAS